VHTTVGKLGCLTAYALPLTIPCAFILVYIYIHFTAACKSIQDPQSYYLYKQNYFVLFWFFPSFFYSIHVYYKKHNRLDTYINVNSFTPTQ